MPYKKYIDTRRRLGFTTDDLENLLKSLTPNDCFKNPEMDRDKQYPGLFWFFKVNAFGTIIYIKFKVLTGHPQSKIFLHIDNI